MRLKKSVFQTACRVINTGFVFLVTGCGFHPLYGTPSSRTSAPNAAAALGQIRINTIADRQGQMLRNELIDRLHSNGDPVDPQYNLIITYNETQSDLGLSNDATSTRGQLTVNSNFTLVNKAGATETSGAAQAVTGYNIQNSEFSTLLSHDDAEQRALRQLADNIQLRLALYFQKKPDAAPVPAPAETSGGKSSPIP